MEYSPVDYDRLLEEVSSIAEKYGGQLDTVGVMSTGEERPLIRYEGSSEREILLMAGEDRDELPGVRSMPSIVEEAGKGYDSLNINLIPFFEKFLPVEEELDIPQAVERYEDVKANMESADVYSGEEVLERFGNELSGPVEEDMIEEVAYDEVNNLASMKTEQGLSTYHHIHTVTGALSEELPKRFKLHYPAYHDNAVRICYNTAKLDTDILMNYLLANMSYHLEELPEEIQAPKELAEQNDVLFSSHSPVDGDFHLFSVDAPPEVTDPLVEELKGEVAVAKDGELEELERSDIKEIRKGIIEVETPLTRINAFVNDYSLVVENSTTDSGGHATYTAVKHLLSYEENRINSDSM